MYVALLYVVARMGANRLCITAAGDLPAKYIIHLVAAHRTASWKTVIANCLNEAESKQFMSVAFPLLGTGINDCWLLTWYWNFPGFCRWTKTSSKFKTQPTTVVFYSIEQKLIIKVLTPGEMQSSDVSHIDELCYN